MKYILSILALTASIGLSHAENYEFQMPSQAEMEQMAKMFESMEASGAISADGTMNPENMGEMMDNMVKMAEQFGSLDSSNPEIAQGLQAMKDLKEYQSCVDKAAGKGTSNKHMMRMMNQDVMAHIQKIVVNTQKYCDAGKKAEATAYMERNMDNMSKSLFPKDFKIMKKCEKAHMEMPNPCES